MHMRLIGGVLAFVIVFITGLILANSQKPLNTLLLTVHKLIALGLLILLVVTAFRANQAARLDMAVIAIVVGAVMLFLATIITGGLLSTEATMPQVVHLIHLVLPFLTVAITATSFHMMHQHMLKV